MTKTFKGWFTGDTETLHAFIIFCIKVWLLAKKKKFELNFSDLVYTKIILVGLSL